MKEKIITVVGPTSAGKTGVAIHLSRKFNGEIISADSRQIYRGMDIGTGKVTKEELDGIRYHLINVLSPGETYSVSQFKKDAEALVEDIISRGKTPIIEGGTGFYINLLTEGIDLPEVEPDPELREELEKEATEELFGILKKLDKKRAERIDKNNRIRLIRAIEIAKTLGEVPLTEVKSKYHSLKIGIDLEDEVLREKINERLKRRLGAGMIKEVEGLIEKGVSTEWLLKIGLEYKYVTKFLNGELTKEEMIKELENKSWQYAKRQRTWFRRDKEIHWFSPNSLVEIDKLVEGFIGGR